MTDKALMMTNLFISLYIIVMIKEERSAKHFDLLYGVWSHTSIASPEKNVLVNESIGDDRFTLAHFKTVDNV